MIKITKIVNDKIHSKIKDFLRILFITKNGLTKMNRKKRKLIFLIYLKLIQKKMNKKILKIIKKLSHQKFQKEMIKL